MGKQQLTMKEQSWRADQCMNGSLCETSIGGEERGRMRRDIEDSKTDGQCANIKTPPGTPA